ncbi:MAG: DUF1588 domain-containing protein [Verrucomicrobia bacterium]|nr:DUF1588 domain-containing protein [Verrucomicrobiota bacterium]
MQTSWHVAWSTSFHNDIARRGRWVRERLLGGRVPDLPNNATATRRWTARSRMRRRCFAVWPNPIACGRFSSATCSAISLAATRRPATP